MAEAAPCARREAGGRQGLQAAAAGQGVSQEHCSCGEGRWAGPRQARGVTIQEYGAPEQRAWPSPSPSVGAVRRGGGCEARCASTRGGKARPEAGTLQSQVSIEAGALQSKARTEAGTLQSQASVGAGTLQSQAGALQSQGSREAGILQSQAVALAALTCR